MKTKNWTMAALVGAAFAVAGPAAYAQEAKAPAAQAAKPAAKPAAQKTFATADEAAKALADAVRAGDTKALLAVMGPKSKAWLFTGDTVSDKAEWTAFLACYDKKNAVVKEGDAKANLVCGDDWPFPAPIVMKGGKWAFDADAGREEVTNRRVGRNELDTIQTLLAVADAQREYATMDADGNRLPDYATRIISSPGKKDGLYWPVKEGEPKSPLGPLVAQAAAEGYGARLKSGKPGAYNGYHYRLLTGQGKDAPGGAHDYLVKGRMMGGFGVIAWPASYGNSGVKTFIVNHDGVVYEKDLGAGTAAAAAKITKFNPDKSWAKAQ